jgi:hypothetical protein
LRRSMPSRRSGSHTVRGADMDRLAWLDGSTDAALARTRADRDAAAGRITELEAQRTSALGGDGDLSVISIIDASITAERHTIGLADQRIAIIERDVRRMAAARRESRRTAAVAAIEKRLAKRTALAGELETAIARVVAIAEQIADTDAIKKPWPFPELLPQWHDWRFHDLGKQIMYSLRRTGGGIMPAEVKQAIGWPESGDGIARAPGPRLPNDLQSALQRNAAHILDSLRAVKINPDDDEAEKAA